ncbi:hypothetical protein CDAR_199761 [Caerostris darwini]|uniref:Uncharacterized protein n=1 Tax=Caerostris darwini TaxID=1538125 RepID=A0AAV4UI57_9ARAC|nr:hypothetical protein CDAR_199761 [Caerostris darwini]
MVESYPPMDSYKENESSFPFDVKLKIRSKKNFILTYSSIKIPEPSGILLKYLHMNSRDLCSKSMREFQMNWAVESVSERTGSAMSRISQEDICIFVNGEQTQEKGFNRC